MLGNLSRGGNVTYASLNQAFVGGNTGNTSALTMPGSHAPVSNSGISGSPTIQRSLSVGTETAAFAGAGSMGSPLSFSSSNLNMTGAGGLVVNPLNRHGSANRLDQQDLLQLQQQNVASNPQYAHDAQQLIQQQQQQQQQQGQYIGPVRGPQVLGLQQQMQGLAPVKAEQHLMSQQQGQTVQALPSVKMEPHVDSPLRQQLQQSLAPTKLEQIDASLRQQLQHQQPHPLQGVGLMKMELRQPDQMLHPQLSIPKSELKSEADLTNAVGQQSLLATHLQRQEALQLHRQQSQQFHAQMNLLQQQRFLQQHRSQLQQQQQQQQLQQQLRQLSAPPKQLFEPGICARRLMQYMFNQRQRPQDNNIHFWRRFVGEFFAHGAKKRWCVSQYGNNGRQPTGVFPQDVWHCKICGSRPGRGFETTVEVLPRLCKIKYDSGIIDELLFVDVSNEYRLSSGFMVLEYGKAIQESIFEQLRVVREGQLRIIFTPELKIHLWEFCARGHEELLPRRLLVPQVTQLAAIAQKYQNSIAQNHNGATSLALQDLQTNCQLFVGAARQLTRTLEAPTVNDLGYTKRYVRCLQISEVVNSMKDLIDFSRENGVGPVASLLNFPRRTGNMATGDALRQEPGGREALPSGQIIGQAGTTIASVNNSSMTMALNSAGHSGATLTSFPTVIHQSAITSLPNSMQMNGSSPSVNSCSSELATSSLTSPQQRTYLSAVQNSHLSMSAGGSGIQPSPVSTFTLMGRQNALSSAVNLLQSSGQFPQGNPHESSNVSHQFHDPMMSSHLRVAGAPHPQQQGLAGLVNTKLSAGLNVGGMGLGTGSMIITANGLGSSGHVNDALGGSGEGRGMSSALSDSDSGNLGGISSSFSDGILNAGFLSSNGNNMMNVGSGLSGNNADGGMQGSSVIADEQSLAIQDPGQSFLNDYGGNDILSSLGNPGFNSLPFNWKSP